jgi:hypothetical protein
VVLPAVDVVAPDAREAAFFGVALTAGAFLAAALFVGAFFAEAFFAGAFLAGAFGVAGTRLAAFRGAPGAAEKTGTGGAGRLGMEPG